MFLSIPYEKFSLSQEDCIVVAYFKFAYDYECYEKCERAKRFALFYTIPVVFFYCQVITFVIIEVYIANYRKYFLFFCRPVVAQT